MMCLNKANRVCKRNGGVRGILGNNDNGDDGDGDCGDGGGPGAGAVRGWGEQKCIS